MKRNLISITFLFIIFAVAGAGCGRRAGVRTMPPPSHGGIDDVSIFYDSLSPYGRWYSVDDYGWVWTPSDMSVGWRPYTDGYWAFTDYGWTWVSAWQWGWAAFHYGRWVHHLRHGWFWVPGRIWGPAWVVWRQRPGWIGWAPMPPHRGWRSGMELEVWDDPNIPIEPFHYSFVEDRNFTARNLDRVLAVPARNVTLLQDARSLTSYERKDNRVINRSFDAEPIERAVGQPIPRRRVVDVTSAGGGERVNGNDVRVYRPDVTRTTTERTPQVTTPSRSPARSSEELLRREERERRTLETEQTREQKRLEDLHRREPSRQPSVPSTDEIRRRQENERRVQQEQQQRERELLKRRQETRRQVEPAAPQTAPKTPARKPAEERKPMPQRKQPGKPQ